MKINKSTFLVLTILLFVIIVELINYVKEVKKEKKLEVCENIIGVCFIYDINYVVGHNSNFEIYYSFNTDSKKIKCRTSKNDLNENWSYIAETLVRKNIPIVFCKNDPLINKIIIDSSDFVKYGIPINDSRSWIKKLW